MSKIKILPVLRVMGGVVACLGGFLVVMSFFFALYSEPIVILNDTEIVISMKNLIQAAKDKLHQ